MLFLRGKKKPCLGTHNKPQTNSPGRACNAASQQYCGPCMMRWACSTSQCVLWSNGLLLCSYSWGFLPSFCFNIRHHNKGGNYERERVSFFLFFVFFFAPVLWVRKFCGFSTQKKQRKKKPFFCDIYTKRKENF